MASVWLIKISANYDFRYGNLELKKIYLLTGTAAWYCCGRYVQVSLSTGCFASPYQPIIKISVNCTIKEKVKSVR